MTPEEFRIAGHRLVDWIADERLRVEERPVQAQVRPGQVAAAFPDAVPTGGRSIDDLIGDLDDIIVPGLTQVQHPSYFAWFPANATLSSVLGDMASSGLGALGITWQSAPALTELETVVCQWLNDLCDLGPEWHGVLQDTASSSCLVAMLSARERASEGSQDRGGLQSEPAPLVVYASDQSHSSVGKAARLAGFGEANVRMLETEAPSHAVDPAVLDAAVEADLAAGNKPAALVLCVGSTGTTAFDPLRPLIEVAERHGLWVHVDAAMAGAAMLLPELRHLFDGIERADSISWNPHKWMGTILDCSMYVVRDPDHLRSVMSTTPSYLRSSAEAPVTEYKDWGVPLGRRFRALKLLFQLGIDGPDEIRNRMRRDLENAAWLGEQVTAHPDWELVAPVPLQTVCVRHVPAPGSAERVWTDGEIDAHTLAWADRLNRSGKAMVTPSQLDGRWMVRVSIGAERTERRHVAAAWELMQVMAAESATSRP